MPRPLATAAVRESDGKGRHTTTSRQLVAGNGLIIVDTPGIRALGAVGSLDAVDQTFPDIAALARNCRFTDCSHTTEPSCAVSAAVEHGELEPERLARYLALRRESERRAVRVDARVTRKDERRATRNNTRGRRDTMRLKGRR